jgi:hypothetical protein
MQRFSELRNSEQERKPRKKEETVYMGWDKEKVL